MNDENKKCKILDKIEKFGENYCNEYLLSSQYWDANKLEESWWEALKFFLRHTFVRGRSNKLSLDYYHFTICVLEKYFQLKKSESTFNFDQFKVMNIFYDIKKLKGKIIEDPGFESIKRKYILIKLLTEELNHDIECKYKGRPLKNKTDILMLLDVLSFIYDKKIKNIYYYFKNEIKNGKAKELYKELDKLHGIGDKLATFIIRDVILLNQNIIESYKDFPYEIAFPVDAWVKNIASILGWREKEDDDVKSWFLKLIKFCGKDKIKIAPVKIAAGLWYFGFHHLKNKKINNVEQLYNLLYAKESEKEII